MVCEWIARNWTRYKRTYSSPHYWPANVDLKCWNQRNYWSQKTDRIDFRVARIAFNLICQRRFTFAYQILGVNTNRSLCPFQTISSSIALCECPTSSGRKLLLKLPIRRTSIRFVGCLDKFKIVLFENSNSCFAIENDSAQSAKITTILLVRMRPFHIYINGERSK